MSAAVWERWVLAAAVLVAAGGGVAVAGGTGPDDGTLAAVEAPGTAPSFVATWEKPSAGPEADTAADAPEAPTTLPVPAPAGASEAPDGDEVLTPAQAGVTQDLPDDGAPGDGAPGDGGPDQADPDGAPPSDRRPGDVPGRGPTSILPRLDLPQLEVAADRAGLPTRALAAYASAALRLEDEQPGCQLTWITLAGIGWVESQHGSFGGSALRPDGTLTGPIIGVPLDGGPGVRAIRDTDGGRLDGDTTWDRAVGPMQFIPSTWTRWAVDANGSGRADPQHIDDAALAAARYLCASGRDLTEGDAWVAAVRSYNRSDAYVLSVLDAANRYADRANAG
jgi:hypothetical protein